MQKVAEGNQNKNGSVDGQQQPNVVVIVPHDLGDYLGCYGHAVSTPNLDRMAREGVRFTNHFCTSPMCSPARGSIITGKYPHTNGLMGLCNLGWDLPDYNITDAQRFADAGYRTYLVGLQHEKKSDISLGFHKSWERHIAGTNYSTDIVMDWTEHLLQTMAEQEKRSKDCSPFYLRLGMFSVHRGFSPISGNYGYDWMHDRGIAEAEVAVLPQWKDTPGLRYDLAGFTGDVNNLDRGIGVVLDALKKYGFADNTLVVFTTDHGIDFPCGKGTLYDLGLRTALVMWYPSRFVGGTVIEGLTSHIDILPTVMDVCGMRQTAGIQGTSLLPLVQGERSAIREEIFAEESTFPKNLKRCIRMKRYKLIRNFCPGMQSNAAVCAASRTVVDTGGFYFVNRPEYELYDLSADPHELRNLVGVEACRTVESDLRERLDCWMRETHDPVLDGSIQRPADEFDLYPKSVLNEHSELLWK